MGFWRESRKWWIGPEHAWENLGRGESNLAMSENAIAFESARSWPLIFPDIESLRLFWKVLEDYGKPGPDEVVGPQSFERLVATIDGREYASVDELLGVPSRNIKNLTIWRDGPTGRHARIEFHMKKANTALPRFTATGGCVFLVGTDTFTRHQSGVKFSDVSDALLNFTRPATLKERWTGASVVPKYTEAEYYADTRANKVRWQSFGLGIVGGILSAMGAAWLPLG